MLYKEGLIDIQSPKSDNTGTVSEQGSVHHFGVAGESMHVANLAKFFRVACRYRVRTRSCLLVAACGRESISESVA